MEWDILTVEEAARTLQVEPAIIVQLLESSELPGRLVAGTWRTTRRALTSFVDGVPLQAVCCTPMSCGPMCCTPAEQMAGGRGCCC
ncbi:MAG: hypothetical protein HYV26_11585 [Candidatus Hydrogenedentes bacterium]|nr:hypothetical protein [Candidatus Hydrogenedentota bacterium]MBI3117788.1 hypothetical protein [Candidatus Hydrogenedentota bacterium]